jgi:hypothetical protein
MNISLPDEITAAMTRGVARGVEESGYVENVDLGKLQQARAADAMLAAAQNEGGSVMGDMMQMGMGVAMAANMANQMGMAQPGAGQPAAPPPLPGQRSYHVDHNGTPGGPYDLGQMRQGIANGTVTGQTLVWSAGMAGWVPAQTVPELQAMFAAPPPLPPRADAPPPPPNGGGAA